MTARHLILAASATIFMVGAALAHGPTPQQAEGEIEIAAPPAEVWKILSDPSTYADWHPGIASVSVEGEGKGAKRTVEFADGGSVEDGIDRIDEENMEIRWRLSKEDREAFPVSYYTNSVTVEPAGEGSTVTWEASFFRADTTNEPEESFSDEAAVTAVEQLIDDGLNGLKSAIEGGSSS
ncbi:SRPBCC family protein [Paracoccus onubensis]|uniref:SRPBCC family protein n=1 Tax=Paracoccus onubensis TaxID=1675788 RepID=A0A418T4T1_9RHOB|nr:SRPBCC family protein [Paracoccus onubensis]RJE88228.1 SRPBCC family protein [Paracoccus onubensis]